MARRDKFIDNARGNFFIVENGLIDRYAAKLTPVGIAVYICLKRHANTKNGESYVSVEKIGATLGLARRTAYRYLSLLDELHLIRVIKTKERTLYYVLAVPRETPVPEGPTLFDDVPPESLTATPPAEPGAVPLQILSAATGTGRASGGTKCAATDTRNKEEQDLYQDDLSRQEPNPELEPPEPDDLEEKKRVADSKAKRQRIVELITALYPVVNEGRAVSWNVTRVFLLLKQEIENRPDYTVDVWDLCVRNRLESLEFIPPARDPVEWITKLYLFAGGPLDRYGRLPERARTKNHADDEHKQRLDDEVYISRLRRSARAGHRSAE
ncbi:MAG: helix-turn-helix domain-containing protein [Acidobacteriia bacterium]|nr:helix-turn-helix domain-containing protein [Terriglobia bacterium]